MISTVAFCPQAPVLVPDLARGAAGELGDVRRACRTAIRLLVAPGRQLVVLGGGAREAIHRPTTRGSLAGFGLDLTVSLGSDEPGPTTLPPALTVGAWLLRDVLGPDCGAVGIEVANPVDTDEHRDELFGDDVGVLVMGDGSARRTLKAPGYLDDRAAAYDEAVVGALRSGDPAALTALDPELGAELLAAGAPAWRTTGELLAGSQPGDAQLDDTGWEAELLYAGAPYGVGYFVASWTRRD